MSDSLQLADPDVQSLFEIIEKDKSLKDFRNAFESVEDVAEFANRAEFHSYNQGENVYTQGEPGTDFFIIMNGQLQVIDESDPEKPRFLSYFGPGDIVGENSMLGSSTRTATVKVFTHTANLAFFDKDDWYWLISKNSRFQDYFENLEEHRRRQSNIAETFPDRQWDEIIVDSTKRHILAFFATLHVPIIILIIPVALLLLAEILGWEPFATTETTFWSLLIIVPFFLASVLLVTYNFFDWRNDDLIVTTRRVIHIERYLFFGEQRKDAPLERVQDVTVTRGVIAVIFDADSLTITTAGAGVIHFANAKRANPIRESIFRERERAKARVAAIDVSTLRDNIVHQFGWENKLPTKVVDMPTSPSPVQRKKTTHHYNPIIDYFIPRGEERDSADGGTIVIWRKHFLVLLVHIALPTIVFLVLFYLFLSSLIISIPPFQAVNWIIQVVLAIGMLVTLFWYIWQYDDWKKDLYIVTDTQIIDIEASSFRLVSSRREGTFDNIQSVYTDVPGIFYKLLNMGNVVIETAGTQDTFTFSMVFDPASVTKEVFDRWSAYQQREREKSRDSTTSQVMEVLKEYHYLNTQLRDESSG